MKKINLLFSTLVFALALLVCGAATVTPVMQAQTLSLQTASNSDGKLSGEVLFDELGRYAVSRNTLEKGLTVENEKHTYKFFGHDWRLVKVDDNYATFWMADPYTKTYFNQIYSSNVLLQKDGSNIWTNGYTKTVWKNERYTADQENGQIILDKDGGSDIRKFLYEEAKTMLDDKAYSKYKDKVVPGYVAGHNEANTGANLKVTYMSFAKQSVNQVEQDNDEADKKQLTAYYDLDTDDRLWLPSLGDLQIWNVLNDSYSVTKPNTLKWTDTTVSNHVWLRTPNPEESYYAMTVSATMMKDNDEADESYFHYRAVKQEAGVRPAIHLDISKIDEEYEDHINNPSGKKNWWDDDWLKILFITIVILGTVGLILVVVGVIVKVRHTRQTHEA